MNFSPKLSLVALAVLAGAGYGVYTLGVTHGRTTAVGAASAHAPGASGAAAPAGAASAATAKGDAAAEADDDMPSGQSVAEGEAATRRHLQTGVRAGMTDPVNGRKVLYYHDPMSPQARFEQPGKSPFMDMMLVPVYAGEGDSGSVQVSARMQQNLGLRTAEVVPGQLRTPLSAVGSITFNERDQAVVQARAGGFVERLLVRATQDRVAKGQPLVELYLPEWVAAQQELLTLRGLGGSTTGAGTSTAGANTSAHGAQASTPEANASTDLGRLVAAARQRMRLLGMSDAQIEAVERSGQVQARTTLHAPMAGVVVEMQVREGMTLMPGAMLFRINGLGSVWAEAEVSEGQLAQLRPGMAVVATSPALPGQRFAGNVQTLLPSVDPNTRTRKARLQIANPQAALVPGMSVAMQFESPSARTALLVPTEAVIQTGERAVVMVAGEKGTFRPVTVVTGAEANGQTEVLRGLQPGLKVVVSSQFLIDSEASLKGLETRLNGPSPSASTAAGPASSTTTTPATAKAPAAASPAPTPAAPAPAPAAPAPAPASPHVHAHEGAKP